MPNRLAATSHWWPTSQGGRHEVDRGEAAGDQPELVRGEAGLAGNRPPPAFRLVHVVEQRHGRQLQHAGADEQRGVVPPGGVQQPEEQREHQRELDADQQEVHVVTVGALQQTDEPCPRQLGARAPGVGGGQSEDGVEGAPQQVRHAQHADPAARDARLAGNATVRTHVPPVHVDEHQGADEEERLPGVVQDVDHAVGRYALHRVGVGDHVGGDHRGADEQPHDVDLRQPGRARSGSLSRVGDLSRPPSERVTSASAERLSARIRTQLAANALRRKSEPDQSCVKTTERRAIGLRPPFPPGAPAGGHRYGMLGGWPMCCR